MTLQQVSYFVRLAEELHYTRAAEKLHITQPTLSYAIGKLEDELGVSLLIKSGKKLKLTQYGEAFLPYAKSALDSLNFGLAKIETLKKPSRTISLGYIYSVSYQLFPNLINNFTAQDENSGVTFQFTLGVKDSLLAGLQDGSLDLVIAGNYDIPGIGKATLLSQELVLVMPKSHPLSKRKELSLQEIKDDQFVFPKSSSGLRHVLDRAFAQAGIIPRIAYEADECNSMAAFASTGAALAIIAPLPSYRDNVSVHRIVNPTLRREIALLWNSRHALSPAAENFRRFVISHDWKDA